MRRHGSERCPRCAERELTKRFFWSLWNAALALDWTLVDLADVADAMGVRFDLKLVPRQST